MQIITEEYSKGHTKRIMYFDKNILHNENGPAIICYLPNGTKYREEYWINGRRHRDDGPAFIEYREDRVVGRQLYFYDSVQLSINRTLFEYKDLKLKIYQGKKIQRFYANRILINMAKNLSDKERSELHDINDSKILLEQFTV